MSRIRRTNVLEKLRENNNTGASASGASSSSAQSAAQRGVQAQPGTRYLYTNVLNKVQRDGRDELPTRQRYNAFDIDSSIWNEVQRYSDIIGDYDWRSKYAYDSLDEEDNRRRARGIIPSALEKRYDLDDVLDRALYYEGLPSSKDIANVAEQAQKASAAAMQAQHEREAAATAAKREASAQATFDRLYRSIYENDPNKYNDLEEEIAALGKLEEKALKNPDSEEGRMYYYLADVLGRANERQKEEARHAAALERMSHEAAYEYGAFEPDVYRDILNTDEVVFDERINSLNSRRDELAQQLNAIEAQIRDINATATPDARRLEALEQQRAQLMTRMQAANQQVAGIEQQYIDYRAAKREAEISAALQPYADIPNAADFERYAQQGAQAVAETLFDSDAARHNYINDTGSGRGAIGFSSGGADPYVIYAHMTGDEIATYNYLRAKEGKEAAGEYLNALESVLTKRNMQEFEERMVEFAEDVPVVSDAVSVLYAPAKASGALYSLLAGDDADPNSLWFAPNVAQSAIRQTRTEQLGGVGGFLYNAGMSMLDTLLSHGTGGKAATVIMGAGAMADTYQAALERGADPSQALTVGALAAISEAVFEKYSIERWVNLKNAGRGAAVMNIFKTMGIEASEEAATEVANIVSDLVVMGELGETHGKSLAELAGQVGLAGLGGLVSGGGFGILGNISNRVNTRRQAVAEQAAAQARQQAEADADQVRGPAQTVEQQQPETASANDRQIENARDTGVSEVGQIAREAAEQIAAEEVAEVETPERRAAEEAEIMHIPNVTQYRAGVNRAFTKTAFYNAVERELSASGMEDTPQNRRTAHANITNQLRGLKDIGKRYDVKIAVHDTIEGGTRNGYFDPQTGVVHVALDAVDNAYMYVGTHELVHYVKQYSADGYIQLEETVMEALAASGEDVDALVKYQMEQFGYDETTAREEVVANSVPAILTDENIVKQLTQGDRTIAQKIMDFVRGLVQSLKNVASRLKGQESWRQLDSLNKDIDTLNGIYDSFRAALQDAAVRGETGNAESSTIKSLLNPSFANEYDAWDGKNTNTRFTVGTTSSALKQVGVRDQRIVWDASKVIKIKNDHPYMTDDVIKQVPNVIENPILVMESKTVDGRITLFGELSDTNGSPVLVALELEPTRGDGLAMNMIKVASAYGKDNAPQALINSSRILYVEPDTEKTRTWLKLYKLQLPSSVKYGLNGRIAYKNPAVNDNAQNGGVKYSAKDPLVRTFEQLEEDNDRMAAQIQEQQQIIDALNSRSELVEQREAALRKAYDEARAELRRTEGIKPNAKKAADAAARIVREYGSKYDREVLAADIRDIYEGFYKSIDLENVGGDVVYNAIAQRVREVAKDIAGGVSVVDSTVYDQTEEMRGYFRGSTIGFDEGQIGEIEVQYETLNAYRKALFGKVNISKDGPGIDGLWAEISKLFPEYFPADTVSSDQPRVLFDVLQSVYDRPVVQPYANDQDAIGDIEATIWDAVLSVPQKVTVADKLAQAKAESRDFESQLKKAQKDIRALKRDMREQAKAAYKDSERVAWWKSAVRRKELSDRYNALLTEESSIKDRSDRQSVERKKEIAKEKNRLRSEYRKVSSQQTDAMAVEREWQRENRERAAERHRGSELRVRIHNKAKALLSWLMRPTEKGLKYVPEYMRNAVADLLRALDFSGKTLTKKAKSWRDALEKLELTLRRAEEDADADDLVFEWDTYADIRKLLEETEGVFEVRNLTTAQLERLDRILSGVQHSIKTANELDVAGKKRELDEMARKVIAELSGKQARDIGKIGEAVKGFLMWDTITPVYAFERMGGTFSQLFGDLEEAQRTLAFTGEDARAFYNSLHNEYDVDKWRDVKNDTFRFTTQRGDEIVLTRGQALSLYATFKREALDTEQGARHLSIGGFVYDKEVKVVTKETPTEDGKTKKEKVISIRDAKPKPLTEADIEKIKKEFLTPRQLEFADKAVEYMSTTLADLGNETSVKQSGFKKFGKAYYFPYKVSSNYTPTSLKASSNENKSLRNAGFTKATVAGARNPVVLQDFFEVFESHTQDMLTYHAFSIAQENMLRVLNWHDKYAEGETAMSVKTALENAFGSEAVKYVETFLRDLGGGIVTDPRESRLTRGIGSFKRAATMAKASVVVQQFSSVFRAWSMVNPKYFASKPMKGAYKQLMKYSGAAVMKRIGGFDTGTGTGEWITDTPVKGAKNKARSFFSKDGKYRNEVFGAAPRFMDEIAWSWIWQAVKKETAAKMGLKPSEISTEKHLVAAGKRVDEVIQKTQVYDSVLSKNPLMRSKSGLAKMVTAFMGEPTLMYSMLVDSVTNVKNKGGMIKHTGPIIGALVLSILVNGASRAFTSAACDDDEEKTYWEKWLDSFVEGLIGQPIKLGWTKDSAKIYGITSDFNPLTWLPLVNDVLSIFQGYDVERTDISLMSDLRDAIWGLSSESKEPYEKGRDLVGALANFTGLPVKNIARDIEAVIRVIGEVIG